VIGGNRRSVRVGLALHLEVNQMRDSESQFSSAPVGISHRQLGLFQGTRPMGISTRRGRTPSYPGFFAKHYGRFLPQDKAAMAAKILNQVWQS